MKYEVGDKVRIVDCRVYFMDGDGAMDKYLGELMTVRSTYGDSYKMVEDNGQWTWYDFMIEGLAEIGYGKTMTMNELQRRGLKNGDIFYEQFSKNPSDWHTGWNIVRKDKIVSLNTQMLRSHGNVKDTFQHRNNDRRVVFLIPIESDVNAGDLSEFMKTFDISLVRNDLISILKPTPRQFINAVHFGNDKRYTWLVPEQLKDTELSAGDIVEVETITGSQYVEVKGVFTENYNEDEDDYKEVISVIRSV